jgi:hypothetical protein
MWLELSRPLLVLTQLSGNITPVDCQALHCPPPSVPPGGLFMLDEQSGNPPALEFSSPGISRSKERLGDQEPARATKNHLDH